MIPTVYIPHGGGPCFFMEWTAGPADTWDKLAEFLRNLDDVIGEKPSAILLVSAHWETSVVTVQSTKQPDLIYDYYNFPPHTYDLQYPAPGDPGLADQVETLLQEAKIPCASDPSRGYDHGVFIPLLLSYPEADVPIVQLSLQQDLNPQQHINIGKALYQLRKQGVLILGSGLSFHNLPLLNSWQHNAESVAFDDWLNEACCEQEDLRNQCLVDWETAPYARLAHPREEHLLPLMVVAGAAGADRGETIFKDDVHDLRISGYKFG